MPENRTMFATDTIWIHREPGVDSAPEDASPPPWLQNAQLLADWHCPADALNTALEVALCDLAGEREIVMTRVFAAPRTLVRTTSAARRAEVKERGDIRIAAP